MGGESESKNDSARGHLSAIFPRGAIAIFPSRRVEGCFSYLKECRQLYGYTYNIMVGFEWCNFKRCANIK
jgi:hypothetical protein